MQIDPPKSYTPELEAATAGHSFTPLKATLSLAAPAAATEWRVITILPALLSLLYRYEK